MYLYLYRATSFEIEQFITCVDPINLHIETTFEVITTLFLNRKIADGLDLLESICHKTFAQMALPFVFYTIQAWAFQIFSVDLIVRAVKQVLVEA